MKTELSNKRFLLHAEKTNENGTIKISGDVTVSDDGIVQNFYGQINLANDSSSGSVMGYGSFSYRLNGSQSNQNVIVSSEYRDEACELLSIALKEITDQITNN